MAGNYRGVDLAVRQAKKSEKCSGKYWFSIFYVHQIPLPYRKRSESVPDRLREAAILGEIAVYGNAKRQRRRENFGRSYSPSGNGKSMKSRQRVWGVVDLLFATTWMLVCGPTRTHNTTICGTITARDTESSTAHVLLTQHLRQDSCDITAKHPTAQLPRLFHEPAPRTAIKDNMVAHRGFSAWITCEGRVLPEFEVAVDNKTHRVTSWIPSFEGKPFVVHWKDHGSKIDTAAYIILDGFTAAGRFLNGEGETYRDGVRTGPSTERPFLFSKVPETETGSAGTATRSQLGIISLKIKRVQRLEEQQSDQPRQVPDRMQGSQKVGDHCVGFGEERQTWLQHPNTYSVQPYDKQNPGSYVTFTFRYRSPEFLHAQGIIESLEDVPKFLPEEPAKLGRFSASPVTPGPTPSPKPAIQTLTRGRRPPGTGQTMRIVSNRNDRENPKFSEFVWSSAAPDPDNPYLKKMEKDDDGSEDEDDDGDKKMTDDTE
ncbi:hypothetical protein OE88DRAFT_1723304 [Heliocybe sulcata]|uniref:DUF7918 domain-containing protein n=1 Tax=Heliocybe sulcata TaxID=5364 RepID=A0A5C3NBY0_9AGAM|nr:hypothetical protein OE88DRAFT_1723304 [Heliocybe sulcata]